MKVMPTGFPTQCQMKVMPTGFPTLDYALNGGMRFGRLMTVLGAAGSGKTLFLASIARMYGANNALIQDWINRCYDFEIITFYPDNTAILSGEHIQINRNMSQTTTLTFETANRRKIKYELATIIAMPIPFNTQSFPTVASTLSDVVIHLLNSSNGVRANIIKNRMGVEPPLSFDLVANNFDLFEVTLK